MFNTFNNSQKQNFTEMKSILMIGLKLISFVLTSPKVMCSSSTFQGVYQLLQLFLAIFTHVHFKGCSFIQSINKTFNYSVFTSLPDKPSIRFIYDLHRLELRAASQPKCEAPLCNEVHQQPITLPIGLLWSHFRTKLSGLLPFE